jgi:hypothetical protein
MKLFNIWSYLHEYCHSLGLPWYWTIQITNKKYRSQYFVHSLHILKFLIELTNHEKNSCHNIVTIQSIVQGIQPFLMITITSDHLLFFFTSTSLIEWYLVFFVNSRKKRELWMSTHGIFLYLLPYFVIIYQLFPFRQVLWVSLTIGEVWVSLSVQELITKLSVVLMG